MDEIRATSARRHVSIKELARRVGIDYGTMRNYLALRRRMTLDVLYDIAAALDTPASAILEAAARSSESPAAHTGDDGSDADAEAVGRARTAEYLAKRGDSAQQSALKVTRRRATGGR